MDNYIATGDRVVHNAPATVASGQGVLVGDIFGVAIAAAASGAPVALQVTGVVRLLKAAGTINPGVRVFWDNSAGRVTTTATGNRPIGFHNGRVANAGSAGDPIEVLLTPAPIATA